MPSHPTGLYMEASIVPFRSSLGNSGGFLSARNGWSPERRFFGTGPPPGGPPSPQPPPSGTTAYVCRAGISN